MNHIKISNKGFTLIEILVVIGIIAILAAVVLIAINPARQFAQARDSQRSSNVNAILNSIGQNMADNKGIFTCAAGAIPTAAAPATGMNSADTGATASTGSYNIRSCIVPTYMSEIPVDPSTGTPCVNAACATGYDTGYAVMRDAVTGRITVTATDTEIAATDISVTR